MVSSCWIPDPATCHDPESSPHYNTGIAGVSSAVFDMAATNLSFVHPYLLSATNHDATGGADEFINAAQNFRWSSSQSLTAPTPRTPVLTPPPIVMGLPLAISVAFIFDEVRISSYSMSPNLKPAYSSSQQAVLAPYAIFIRIANLFYSLRNTAKPPSSRRWSGLRLSLPLLAVPP